ncbi:MAG: LysM peptidoglycan-binding domain-containing protein [Ferruginibacter sp.]
MKKLIVLLFFIPLFVNAQTTHTVTAKETLYSLGREYNIHPKELAAYNNIPFDKGLVPGQVLKIPAKGKLPAFVTAPVKTDVTVKEKTPEKTTAAKPATIKAEPVKTETVSATVPIYHKVTKKETLYHISTLYNKVPIADIKKWNHLTGDGLSEGTELIVGYKKASKEEAMQTTAAVIKPAPATIKTEEPTGNDIVKRNPPTLPDVSAGKISQPKTLPVNPVTGKNFNGGFFKSIYINQPLHKMEEKGEAGIFKSTSGWEDGKYYCLHNTAQAGSIIKITSTATNKTIYAKVLDVIPDLKQNSGLVMRISNAAAEELGVGANNFECTINY